MTKPEIKKKIATPNSDVEKNLLKKISSKFNLVLIMLSPIGTVLATSEAPLGLDQNLTNKWAYNTSKAAIALKVFKNSILKYFPCNSLLLLLGYC